MIRLFKIYIHPELFKSHKYLCHSLELDYSDFIVKTMEANCFNLQIIPWEIKENIPIDSELVVVKDNNLKRIKDDINQRIIKYEEIKKQKIYLLAQKNLKELLNEDYSMDKIKSFGDVFSSLSTNEQMIEMIKRLILRLSRKNLCLTKQSEMKYLDYIYPFYQLRDFDDLYFQCVEKPNQEEKEFILSILLSLNYFTNKKKQGHESNLKYQIFYHLPHPVLLIKESGEIVMSNNAFNDLNTLPRIFLSYKNNDTIDINLKVFQVFCRRLNDGCILFILQSFDVLENQKDKQYRDLGIMTSSLAHEFKNPLAGILAAVNVLELDEWPTESFELICEIKKSAERSNELVETFLGFSRQQERVPLTQSGEDHLAKFFSRAYNLCKARLVEEQYAMNMSHKVHESFDVAGRGSMYTMLFYLYFQDIITQFQKAKLIEGHPALTINLTLIENKRSFTFVIHSFIYKLTYNRLRNYLAHNLHLTIQKKGEEIIFIKEDFSPH